MRTRFNSHKSGNLQIMARGLDAKIFSMQKFSSGAPQWVCQYKELQTTGETYFLIGIGCS